MRRPDIVADEPPCMCCVHKPQKPRFGGIRSSHQTTVTYLIKMNSFRYLAFLILLSPPYLCSSHVLISETKSPIAFFPRGGGRKKSSRVSSFAPTKVDTPTKIKDNILNDDGDDDEKSPQFDRQAVSKQLHTEKTNEIKKSQQFLIKQQKRRDLDKTWLDKGITSIIEFFENMFRWEVIDV